MCIEIKDERNLGSRSWSATAEAEVSCSLLSLVWLVCLSKSLFVDCCRIDYWSRDGAPKTNLHWIVPMLFSILFDIGMLLIFVALISYLTDAYEIYATSANAASSITRSFFFWSCIALSPLFHFTHGSVSARLRAYLVSLVSLCLYRLFAFVGYGVKIRAKSWICRDLAERNRMDTNTNARIHDADTRLDAKTESQQRV